jgi:hypothetical protein
MNELSNADYIKSLLKVNELNIEGELATCSSFFFTFSALAIDAEQLHDKATIKLETYEAELAKKQTTEKPDITQTEIKRQFRADTKWNQLKTEELDCQRDYKIVAAAAKAFEMKSNNMANINRRQIAKVEKGIEDFK